MAQKKSKSTNPESDITEDKPSLSKKSREIGTKNKEIKNGIREKNF